MAINRILYAVARKWWLIFLLIGLCGGLGYYQNIMSVHPMYSANATLYVLNRDKVEAGQMLSSQDLNMSQTFLKQYSGIFYSRTVALAASNELTSYNIPYSMLSSMVRISSQENSNLLTISATAPDPELAAAAANAMGKAFIAQILTITKSDYIGTLDEAQVPIGPIPGNGMKKTLLWILAGIVISLGIIYLLEYFDTTVRFAEDIETGLKTRIIGIIPEHNIR